MGSNAQGRSDNELGLSGVKLLTLHKKSFFLYNDFICMDEELDNSKYYLNNLHLMQDPYSIKPLLLEVGGVFISLFVLSIPLIIFLL